MRLLGLGLIGFVVLAAAAFSLLAANFGYDDILREPPAVILAQFKAGGDSLIFTWAAFMLSAALFAPLAVGVGRWLESRYGIATPIAVMCGVVSAVLQAVGLSRWVFVAPVLAERHAADPAGAETALMVINQYGGVAIGEHLGQLFLIGWTVATAVAFWRTGDRFLRIAAAAAGVIAPMWLVGQTELFATVSPATPVVELAPIAFTAWEVWVVAIGVFLIATARKQPA